MTESCRLVTTEQLKEYKLLEKKLDIAVKVLEHYRDSDWWWEAKEALKEMEGVK